jgi:hypothetical protein
VENIFKKEISFKQGGNIMRIASFVLSALIIAYTISGCGPKISTSKSMDRQQEYNRIAIVCASGPEADPAYAPLILEQVKSRIFPLEFLETVDCLSDIVVDTNSTPPILYMDDFNKYNAIVTLVYSYDSGHVYLDLYMIDTVTLEQIWNHRFDSSDPEIKKRLLSQGLYTPAIIREDFYGL